MLPLEAICLLERAKENRMEALLPAEAIPTLLARARMPRTPSGRLQALQLLDGIDLDLPLVFDAEIIRDDEARTDSVNLSQFTENARAFCQAVTSAGYDTMIYTNLLFEGLIYDLSELSEYPVWYADYGSLPQTPYQFTWWQYTEKGNVDGVENAVDRNVWFLPIQ